MMIKSLDLKTAWYALVRHYGVADKRIDELYDELETHYGDSGRHYHTFTHVRAMLDRVEAHASTLTDADAVRLAVWYHDVVYNPLRSDNEERSAQLAGKRLHSFIRPEQLTRVEKMIRRTHNHTEVQPDEDTDTRFFLDCDLLILGADWETYDRYRDQIRQEYRVYPDLLYNPGRKKALRRFLEAPFIYRITWFAEKFETQARANLTRELALLS